MPNLNCPLCQNAMQETNRNGISIDTCPRCRGVWLDRGELEKLATALAHEMTPAPMPQQPVPPQYAAPHPQTGYAPAYNHYRYDDDDDDRYKHYGKHGYPPYRKKSAIHSLLDFFD